MPPVTFGRDPSFRSGSKGVGGAFLAPIAIGVSLALFGHQTEVGAKATILRQSVHANAGKMGGARAIMPRMGPDFIPIARGMFGGEARGGLIALTY